jgi:Reverse transcriptase (RNA-dependent DNA polymerase)
MIIKYIIVTTTISNYFGNYFIKWVKIISTNREACIILKNNLLGKNFKLERGNAQGDTISPFLFNICYQILLFKFEFDLQIEKVPTILPDAPVDTAPGQTGPVSYYSRKVFTFADDCNLAVKSCRRTMTVITEVLAKFAEISGLECNIEKSNYLEFGHIDNEDVGTGIGLVKKDNLKILGMTISNSRVTINESNSAHITRKINDQVSKWNRFNLSLAGRIRIAKTMLYSQINYLGSFLDFDMQCKKRWEAIIYAYVKGNLNISLKRCFLPVKNGGLGLPDLNDFIDSQRCTWIIHASRNINAAWKEIIRRCSLVDYFNHDITLANTQEGCITGMVTAFNRLKKGYAMSNNNYLKMLLLKNELFTVNTRNVAVFEIEDLDPDLPDPVRNTLMSLTLARITTNGVILSRADLIEKIGHFISPALYKKLSDISRTARTRYHHDNCLSGISMGTFLGPWKKGSKRLRNHIEYNKHISISHNIVKFAENTNTVIGLDCALKLNTQWSLSFFNHTTSTFLFKLTNNTLCYNSVLSHFVRGHSRNCTLCDLVNNPEIEDENCLHLFYSCEVAERLRNDFFKWLTSDENFILSRHEFFCCTSYENKNKNFIMMTTIRIFIQYIWECKLRKNLPVLDATKRFIFNEMELIKNTNLRFKIALGLSGINFSQQRLV